MPLEKYYFCVRRLLKKKGNTIEMQDKSTQQWVGKFAEGQPVPATCKDKLDEEGQFELEWYLDCVDFNRKNFNVSSADIEKVRLLLAPRFFNALMVLSIEAKRRNIDFSPMETMLNALLEKAKAVEQEIEQADGKPINILESLGVYITS